MRFLITEGSHVYVFDSQTIRSVCCPLDERMIIRLRSALDNRLPLL